MFVDIKSVNGVYLIMNKDTSQVRVSSERELPDNLNLTLVNKEYNKLRTGTRL